MRAGCAWSALGSGQVTQAMPPTGHVDLQIDELPSDVRFVDAQHGWLLGSHSVWRTTDGGNTWKQSQVLPNNRG
jgi:photosystem II stability/assembly factor-like uncharacterized protein